MHKHSKFVLTTIDQTFLKTITFALFLFDFENVGVIKFVQYVAPFI